MSEAKLIGNRRAVQPLVKALLRSLETWHPEITGAVFEAIQQVNGRSELVEPLIAYLPQAGFAIGYIIELLGEIGDQRAVEPLRDYKTIYLNISNL